MLSEQVRRARLLAKEIMDQEWIAVGKTREELDREEQIDHLFNALIGAGYSEEALAEEWRDKTPEQVLCEYTPRLDALREPPNAPVERKAA